MTESNQHTIEKRNQLLQNARQMIERAEQLCPFGYEIECDFDEERQQYMLNKYSETNQEATPLYDTEFENTPLFHKQDILDYKINVAELCEEFHICYCL